MPKKLSDPSNASKTNYPADDDPEEKLRRAETFGQMVLAVEIFFASIAAAIIVVSIYILFFWRP